MKVKEGKEYQRNSVWLPGNERCWGSLPNYKRSVCPLGRTEWALHCPLQPGQCSRSVSTWWFCYPFINVAVGMSEGICTLPAKKQWAMCGTLGKGNAGMRPNQKVFLTAVIHSEKLFFTSWCLFCWHCFNRCDQTPLAWVWKMRSGAAGNRV